MRCSLRALLVTAMVSGAGLAAPAHGQEGPRWSSDIKPERVLEGHEIGVTTLAFSPDGKTLVSGSGERTLKVWDPANGKERRTLEAHVSPVIGLKFSLDGKYLLSAEWKRRVVLWNMQTLEVEQLWRLPTVALGAAFTPAGEVVIAAGTEVRIYDVGREEPVRMFSVPAHIYSLGLSADGKYLATGHADGFARVWELASGTPMAETFVGMTPEQVQELPPAEREAANRVGCVVFVDDRRLLVDSKNIHLWTWRDASAGKAPVLGPGRGSVGRTGSLLVVGRDTQLTCYDMSLESPRDALWTGTMPLAVHATAASAEFVAVGGGAKWNPDATMYREGPTGIQLFRTAEVRARMQAARELREERRKQVEQQNR